MNSPYSADRRLFRVLEAIRKSFWALPTTIAVVAVALSRIAVWLDVSEKISGTPIESWFYGGTQVGARSLLSSLAASMITAFGVVLSVTVVTLSFASSHLGPRLLREFLQDRSTRIVLGSCVAVFLYCLSVLFSMHSEGAMAVPRVAVTVGVVLTGSSFVILIYFVHLTVRRIQVDNVVQDVASELCESIDRLFPDAWAEQDLVETLDVKPTTGTRVYASRRGYVQAIDFERLAELAGKGNGRITCLVKPAEFVIDDGPLAEFAGEEDESRCESVAACFVIGGQRTETQDVEYSIRQLVEIALRALSPGVNDPFTAIACIDNLGASMAQLAQRSAPEFVYQRGGGVVTAPGVTFQGAMDMAWNQLRQHGASQPAIAIRLLEALRDVGTRVPSAERGESVRAHARSIHATALRADPLEMDRTAIEKRVDELEELLNSLPESHQQ